MKWRSVRFDWNHARSFLVTAEEGSLSKAARALAMSQPTVGRQIAALEEELSVALFERSPRGLELTPNGLMLMEHVRGMGDAATRFSLAATGQSRSIEGSICISATEVDAVFTLPPIIQRLRHAEPGIDVEIIASQAASDLKRREADIAIRAFRPTQPELIAKRLADAEAHLYAAKTYLAELGHPTSVDELSQADFVGIDRSDILLNAYKRLGLDLSLENFKAIAESHIVHWALVKQGVGIGVMTHQVGDAEPLVDRALPSLEPLGSELWLVTHRELNTSLRVRRVFDFLFEELSGR